jgi:Polysaccharide pyruvyl transferase
VRVLVTGWFSFVDGEATVGDLLAKDVACRWLRDAAIEHDVALSPMFEDGVAWDAVEPQSYHVVLFVCGPAAGVQVERLADRFRSCRLVGLNVSVVDETAAALFDALIERDGRDSARPDLSLGAPRARLPVIGIVRSHAQPEYGDRSRLDDVHAAIDRLLSRTAASVVEFDTRVDPRVVGIRNCAEIESLVARMDLVVTTRLHGLVVALRNGVPALAVDPIRGGAKVLAQARAIGWPAALACDEATDEALVDALAFCLHPAAASQATGCATRGAQRLADLAAKVRQALDG